MKDKYHLKRLLGGAVWFGLAALLFAQGAFGQGFISREYRPRWLQEYENFGGYDIRKNPTHIDMSYDTWTGRTQNMGALSRVTYDPFGNFLLPGGTVYNMQWDRSRVGSMWNANTGYSSSVFNNLMISADEFSNWQTKFMIGQAYTGTNWEGRSSRMGGLRTFFTPSTLKITNFNGVRWDLSSRKNNVSLIVENPGSAGVQSSSGTNTYGIHWQSILGDILQVGGTFVTRQRGTVPYAQTDIDHDEGTSFKGIRDEPRYVYLVLTDDSPEDYDSGGRVYDIKVKVNGSDITNQVPVRTFKITDLLNRKRYYDGNFQKQYIFEQAGVGGFFPKKIEDNYATEESWFLNVMGATTGNMYPNIFSKTDDAKFYGMINLPDFNDASNPNGRYFAADTSTGYQEAAGTDVVIYEFLIPSGTRELKFDVLAANDYNLDIVAAMYRSTQTGEAGWNDQPLTSAWSGKWSVIYDAKNAAKANGNVKDASNTKWITVAYDRVSGMSVYGLNMELNWRGLMVKGEINEYNAKSSYPINANLSGAARHDVSSRAWFLNVEKDFGSWAFGGEVYNYPLDYMRYMGTVDDNDDDDDITGSYESEYPGYDVDWDRDWDNTQNGRAYLEYYYDDNVVFGDDFNHNGTIDARENDYVADLPYERNSEGQHYFVKMKPRERTLFTLGHYDLKQQSKDGRNLTDYVKAEHFQGLGRLGEFSVQHRSEMVKYNHFNTYRFGTSGSYLMPVVKDTFMNTTLLHTRLKPIQGMNVINDVKAIMNKDYGDAYTSAWHTIYEHQIKQTPIKQNRRNTKFYFVHKADYTLRVIDRQILPDVYVGGLRLMKAKRIKDMSIQPQIKFENNFWTAYNVRLGEWYQHQDYRVYPILRIDYQIAPNTKFRFGMQGFPGFEELYRIGNVERYTEYALSEYNNRRYIIAFENRTLYQGFNLVVLLGMSRTKKEWVESRGRDEEGNTQFFFTVQSEASR